MAPEFLIWRVVGQEFEDGSLKTQTRVRYGLKAWQAHSEEAESRSTASDVKASIRSDLVSAWSFCP